MNPKPIQSFSCQYVSIHNFYVYDDQLWVMTFMATDQPSNVNTVRLFQEKDKYYAEFSTEFLNGSVIFSPEKKIESHPIELLTSNELSQLFQFRIEGIEDFVEIYGIKSEWLNEYHEVAKGVFHQWKK